MSGVGRCLVVLVLLALALPAAAAADEPRSVDAAAAARKALARGAARPDFGSTFDCLTRAPAAPDFRLDCDTLLPNDEPNVAVDPTDPLHLVASSNDYDSCCDEYYTSFDGGRTWATGNMSAEDPTRLGSDPVSSFDVRHGVVLHASLNYQVDAAGAVADGDVVVSRSTDGGRTWLQPVVVGEGVGADGDAFSLFNDKEWIASDDDPRSPFYGRTYLTWSAFAERFGEQQRSPIVEAHSDDGGLTWSAPQEISGRSAAFCTFQLSGPAGACDEDQASTIAIGPDGSVAVAFENEQHAAAWEPLEAFENQYLVVRSRDGGATWSPPLHVVDMEDGSRDYPFNVDGVQTLTNQQIRVWSVGNVTADPRTGRLWLVFSDNRAGRRDVIDPATNANVYVMSSQDGGATWSGPFPLTRGREDNGDQFFPFATVDPLTGMLGVLYLDTRWGGSPRYWASFATGLPGRFTTRKVSSAASSPDQSKFFQAQIPGCRRCATFAGDYIGAAYGPDGAANLLWTDMSTPYGVAGAHAQFVFFARR